MPLDLTPQTAWLPLPALEWNEATARHLLRRLGWSAEPDAVARLLSDGLPRSLERLFPVTAAPMPEPAAIAKLREELPELTKAVREASTPPQKQLRQRELRDRERQVSQDLALRWLHQASQPGTDVTEKWVLFLGDIFVVSGDKVENALLLYRHQALLREKGLGPAPALAKAVSRSPAMIRYLDLQDSRKSAPNENFARELFELFILGEGNYSEQDIKEAARAFTGYRLRAGEFFLVPNQRDTTPKTLFGQTGAYDGDAVIDLAYAQPAAGTFVPRELTRFYLTEQTLPADLYAPLGAWWATTGHDLRALALRFFQSRLFFHREFRGAFVKSPIHFYLGLLQDLNLHVTPLPGRTLSPLRLMGQTPFRPPNVRGWVGGRLWINSATLAARRQLVQALFNPIDEEKINADERLELAAARTAGRTDFTVSDTRLHDMLSKMDDAAITARFVDYFLPVVVSPAYRAALLDFLQQEKDPARRLARVRTAAVTLLQSPEYQLA